MSSPIAPLAGTSDPAPVPLPVAAADGAAKDGALAAARLARAEAAAVEFEAAMLTSFVEPMLPSEDNEVWGGTGAHAWRGLFARELAAEMAAAGGIGLADLVRPSLVAAASGTAGGADAEAPQSAASVPTTHIDTDPDTDPVTAAQLRHLLGAR